MKKNPEFLPNLDLVKHYSHIVSDNFKVRIDNLTKQKMVIVDEKIHYLTGPFVNKTRTLNKMYHEIQQDEFHVPSLRKAIRDWISKNSK